MNLPRGCWSGEAGGCRARNAMRAGALPARAKAFPPLPQRLPNFERILHGCTGPLIRRRAWPHRGAACRRGHPPRAHHDRTDLRDERLAEIDELQRHRRRHRETRRAGFSRLSRAAGRILRRAGDHARAVHGSGRDPDGGVHHHRDHHLAPLLGIQRPGAVPRAEHELLQERDDDRRHAAAVRHRRRPLFGRCAVQAAVRLSSRCRRPARRRSPT